MTVKVALLTAVVVALMKTVVMLQLMAVKVALLKAMMVALMNTVVIV